MADNQRQYWLEVVFGPDPDNIGFFGTSGIVLPGGTTLQRPPGLEGHIRYNTDTTQLEFFNGTVWATLESAIGGATFLSLSDTPGSYTGTTTRTLRVNAAADALEFSTALQIENDGSLTTGTLNYENLVTTDDHFPNAKFVNDADILRVLLAGDSMDPGAVLTFSAGGTVRGLPALPLTDTDAASKAYVDSLAAGLDPKESVRIGTTTDLDTETGDTWTPAGSGVGKTITSDASTASFDSVAVADGDRVLVKDEGGGLGSSHNGIYDVSGVGAAVVLTRATDQDGSPSNEVSGGNFTFIELGTIQAGSGWVVVFDGELAIDSDSMIWTQFSDLGITTLIQDADLDTKIDVEEGPDDDTIRMDVGDDPAGYTAVTDIFVLNAAGWSVDMGTPGLGSGVAGAPISLTAGDGAAEGGVGGAFTVVTGTGTQVGALMLSKLRFSSPPARI